AGRGPGSPRRAARPAAGPSGGRGRRRAGKTSGTRGGGDATIARPSPSGWFCVANGIAPDDPALVHSPAPHLVGERTTQPAPGQDRTGGDKLCINEPPLLAL